MENELIKDMNTLIMLSLSTGPSHEFDVDFTILEGNIVYTAYTASVAYKDILLYTDKGILTYLVDSYGDNHTIELFNIEE